MDKKSKLWLGAGVLAVGAYLLWKSKKAAAVVTSAPAPANLVGFANQSEGLINSLDVKGGHAGVHHEGIFKNVEGKKPFANQPFSFSGSDKDPVGQRKMPFADTTSTGQQKFNAGGPKGDGAGNFKGFADMSSTGQQKFNAGGPIGDGAGNFANIVGAKNSGEQFFNPQTVKFGSNQGVFAPKAKPLNNLVGADGSGKMGLINGPAVHQVWGN
jgi:hypothetical protein